MRGNWEDRQTVRGEALITVVIPSSDKSMLLERAARLRCMAEALSHDLDRTRTDYEMKDEEWYQCQHRITRWTVEAAAFEQQAGLMP